MNIPSRFREVLVGSGDDRVIVTNFVIDELKCLDVYPLAEWQQLEEEMIKKPRFEPRIVSFQNYYLGAAQECSVDSHGRILIPTDLRKYADLKRSAVVVGVLQKFRVWDKDTFNRSREDAEGRFAREGVDL